MLDATVLIIDDDDDILSLFEDALEELGDEVLVNGGNGRF